MIDDLCPLCGSLQTLAQGRLVCACGSNLHRTLTVRQAAAYLHMSPSGVYHLINDGYLAAIRGSRPLQVRMSVLKFYVTPFYVMCQHDHSPEQGRA